MLSSRNDLACIYSKQITEHGFGTTGVQAYLPGQSLQAAIPAEIRVAEKSGEMDDERTECQADGLPGEVCDARCAE